MTKYDYYNYYDYFNYFNPFNYFSHPHPIPCPNHPSNAPR